MAKKTVKKVVRRVKKVTTPVVPPVQENAAVVETATVTSTPTTTETNVVETPVVDEWETTWTSVLEQTSHLATTVKTLNSTLKQVHKQWTRALKDARKKSTRKKKSNGVKRAPSGFAKPSLISAELCEFLGKPVGTEMARTEVTRHLTQYIKANSLQNPANKRIILPDDKLNSLLQVEETSELTYFNLQKYMKRHFPKKGTTTNVVATA